MSVPVPKLRFKNFSQALINGPFEQYIKSSKYGPRFDANDYDLNGNVKTIRGTDVALDATIKYEQVPIANLPQKLIDEHQLQEGDILMITTADCGLSAVFEKQEIPFIASAYAVRIVLKNSLDSLWVKYYLQTQHIVNEVNKYVRKGTLSNLPLSDISKFSFTVPALEEQTKIATFLSAVDEKISQLTQKHELLSQYKQGMMQKLFSQQIRFKADDGSEFGEWVNKKIIEIADYVDFRGKTPKKVDNGILLVTAKNIRFGYIDYEVSREYIGSDDFEEVMRRGCAKIGDVLITTEAPLGNVASVDREDIALAQRVIKYRGKEGILNNAFLKQKFLSEDFQALIASKATGGTVQGIKGSTLHNLEIYIPQDIEEQTKIANFLSSIDQKIEVVAQQIEQAKQWKKGLLQQMFV